MGPVQLVGKAIEMSGEKYEDTTAKHAHLEEKGILQDVILPVAQELKPVAEVVAGGVLTHRIIHGKKPPAPQDGSKKDD